ncbi:MAG: YraN family protein [Acidobacteria bacterium]|nr:YraN family protein [Acidobacteriota bacterium]
MNARRTLAAVYPAQPSASQDAGVLARAPMEARTTAWGTDRDCLATIQWRKPFIITGGQGGSLARALLLETAMGSDATVALGIAGEDLACQALVRLGYAILARRYHTRVGEIDIVARDGAAVVFVEVKARSSTRYGRPAEAVTRWKQRRIGLMAQHFLSRHRLHGVPCRFDVVSVLCPRGEAPSVEVIRDAFQAG